MLHNQLPLFLSSQCVVGKSKWKLFSVCGRGCVIGPTFHFNIPELNFGEVSFGKWTIFDNSYNHTLTKKLLSILVFMIIFSANLCSNPKRLSSNLDLLTFQYLIGIYEFWSANSCGWDRERQCYQYWTDNKNRQKWLEARRQGIWEASRIQSVTQFWYYPGSEPNGH